MSVKLSTLAVVLGLGVVALNLWGVLKPSKFAVAARKFPRSVPIGTVLMLLSTVWFILNVKSESLSDFENLKTFLFLLFAAVGIGTCLFVKDFLGARGLAAFMLLLAKLMVDTARWHDSGWRTVITLWAYVLVVAGMWFTVSPWRLRDMIQWNTATVERTRLTCGVRVGLGVVVILLGVCVF